MRIKKLLSSLLLLLLIIIILLLRRLFVRARRFPTPPFFLLTQEKCELRTTPPATEGVWGSVLDSEESLNGDPYPLKLLGMSQERDLYGKGGETLVGV